MKLRKRLCQYLNNFNCPARVHIKSWRYHYIFYTFYTFYTFYIFYIFYISYISYISYLYGRSTRGEGAVEEEAKM